MSGKGPKADAEARRILLIEDSKADAGLVREALREHDVSCELTLISDGGSAMEYIESIEAGEESCPDLIILDLNLPKRDGSEILSRIRKSANCRNISVVVLTSSDNQRDRDAAARLGASRYIRKPFRLEEFLGLGCVFRELLQHG